MAGGRRQYRCNNLSVSGWVGGWVGVRLRPSTSSSVPAAGLQLLPRLAVLYARMELAWDKPGGYAIFFSIESVLQW